MGGRQIGKNFFDGARKLDGVLSRAINTSVSQGARKTGTDLTQLRNAFKTAAKSTDNYTNDLAQVTLGMSNVSGRYTASEAKKIADELMSAYGLSRKGLLETLNAGDSALADFALILQKSLPTSRTGRAIDPGSMGNLLAKMRNSTDLLADTWNLADDAAAAAARGGDDVAGAAATSMTKAADNASAGARRAKPGAKAVDSGDPALAKAAEDAELNKAFDEIQGLLDDVVDADGVLKTDALETAGKTASDAASKADPDMLATAAAKQNLGAAAAAQQLGGNAKQAADGLGDGIEGLAKNGNLQTDTTAKVAAEAANPNSAAKNVGVGTVNGVTKKARVWKFAKSVGKRAGQGLYAISILGVAVGSVLWAVLLGIELAKDDDEAEEEGSESGSLFPTFDNDYDRIVYSLNILFEDIMNGEISLEDGILIFEDLIMEAEYFGIKLGQIWYKRLQDLKDMRELVDENYDDIASGKTDLRRLYDQYQKDKKGGGKTWLQKYGLMIGIAVFVLMMIFAVILFFVLRKKKSTVPDTVPTPSPGGQFSFL